MLGVIAQIIRITRLELRNASTALPNSLWIFGARGYLVRRGTLCEHRLEKDTVEKRVQGMHIFRSSGGHSHFTCGTEYFLPGAPTSPTGTISSFKHQTLDSLFFPRARLAGQTFCECTPTCTNSQPNFSKATPGHAEPVKKTRDSHSEQCISRKKTPAGRRCETQCPTVLMRFSMRRMASAQRPTYFVV